MNITIKGLQALLLSVKTHGSHFLNACMLILISLAVTHYRLSDTTKCKLVQLNLEKIMCPLYYLSIHVLSLGCILISYLVIIDLFMQTLSDMILFYLIAPFCTKAFGIFISFHAYRSRTAQKVRLHILRFIDLN